VRHEFPEVLAALAQQHQAGECVFVTKDAVPSVRFYAGPAGQAFIYVPLTAGTRPLPRYDYDALVRDTVASAGWRWWVLTTSDAIDPVRQQLFAKARQLGYDARLVAGERGQEDPVFHVAQLYRMDRSGP
jgi:hypothetical protein